MRVLAITPCWLSIIVWLVKKGVLSPSVLRVTSVRSCEVMALESSRAPSFW